MASAHHHWLFVKPCGGTCCLAKTARAAASATIAAQSIQPRVWWFAVMAISAPVVAIDALIVRLLG